MANTPINESFAIARLWAAAAWADGELHPAEAAAYFRFLEAAGLDDAQKLQAEGFLEKKPAVSFDEVEKLSTPAKEGLYRAIIGLVLIDGKVTDDELQFVTRLRDQLGLDAATILRIESEKR